MAAEYVAFPGAVQKRIDRNYGRKRTSTRGVILHVDAGNANSLQGWFNNPKAKASSNLYVKLDGTIEQYVDMDTTSWTSGDASGSTVGVETQGFGQGQWTPQQVASIIRIILWCADRYGVPIQPMRTSKAGERGVGWHRLGVPATAGASTSLTGGQLWSRSAGKICPGPDRIAQIPSILAAAAAAAVPSDPPTEDDMTPELKARLDQIVQWQDARFSEIEKRTAPINRGGKAIPLIQEVADTKTLALRNEQSLETLTGAVLALTSKVDALLAREG